MFNQVMIIKQSTNKKGTIKWKFLLRLFSHNVTPRYTVHGGPKKLHTVFMAITLYTLNHLS